MKLILENWRKYVNEADTTQKKLGAYVSAGPAQARLALVDLSLLKSKLEQSKNIEDFSAKIQDSNFYKDSVVGYIDIADNKYMAKAHPNMGGSGGQCAGTWSVKQSIGRGYGRQLYDALLGWAAEKEIYITPDRSSVTGKDTGKAAAGRWASIDSETSDETPPKDDVYMGKFDNWEDKATSPQDDDCQVYGVDSLDKGYKNSEKIEYFKELQNNFDEFFTTEIESLFDEPGFFGKLFGGTPQNKAQKIKNQLLRLGAQKFIDFSIQNK